MNFQLKLLLSMLICTVTYLDAMQASKKMDEKIEQMYGGFSDNIAYTYTYLKSEKVDHCCIKSVCILPVVSCCCSWYMNPVPTASCCVCGLLQSVCVTCVACKQIEKRVERCKML